MRILAHTSVASPLAISVSLLIGASPALTQTGAAQVQIQNANAEAQCTAIADPAERQACVEAQVQNPPSDAGTPSGAVIVVTGSRIPRPNFETVQPSTVLNSQAIEQRGFVTSRLGEPTPQRGGKRKRLYTLQPAGERALARLGLAHGLWRVGVPELRQDSPGHNDLVVELRKDVGGIANDEVANRTRVRHHQAHRG